MAPAARHRDSGRIGTVLLYQPFVSYRYICVRMLLYMCPNVTGTESSLYCSSMVTHITYRK